MSFKQINEAFSRYMRENISDSYDMLKKAYNGSYYTIIGAGGDIDDWKNGYQKLLDEANIGKIKEWITFRGTDMNDLGKLSNDNRYPDDITFLAFPLDGLDIGKLAMFKLKMGDRWFDDIIDNNADREGYHPFDSAFSTDIDED